MKKRVITLTESQLVEMIKKTVKKVLKEEDETISSEGPNYKYNAEDIAFWELNDNILTIAFGEEDYEDYDVDYEVSTYHAGSDATYDHPGDPEEIEMRINSVKQIHPVEKKMTVGEFEKYLRHLGIHNSFWKTLDEKGYEQVQNYDGPDYDDW